MSHACEMKINYKLFITSKFSTARLLSLNLYMFMMHILQRDITAGRNLEIFVPTIAKLYTHFFGINELVYNCFTIFASAQTQGNWSGL